MREPAPSRLTAEQHAERLHAPLDDAMEAHRMLDLAVTDTDGPDHYCTEAEREAELELPYLALARGEILFLRVSDVAHQQRQSRGGLAKHFLHGVNGRRNFLVDALYVRHIEHRDCGYG